MAGSEDLAGVVLLSNEIKNKDTIKVFFLEFLIRYSELKLTTQRLSVSCPYEAYSVNAFFVCIPRLFYAFVFQILSCVNFQV